MTDLVLLPDVEALVSGWLRAQPELVAMVADRVYTELPVDKVWPLVRVRQIGGSGGLDGLGGIPYVGGLVDLQVEAYGGPKAMARTVAEMAHALLAQRLVGVVGDGVLATVNTGALRDVPDPAFSPAKPRWLFTASVGVRPATAAMQRAQARALEGAHDGY